MVRGSAAWLQLARAGEVAGSHTPPTSPDGAHSAVLRSNPSMSAALFAAGAPHRCTRRHVHAPGPASGLYGVGPAPLCAMLHAGPDGGSGTWYWPGSGGSSERFLRRLQEVSNARSMK